MYTALVILILVVCLLLSLVVLAQNPKGGGLSSQFGAGGAANLMGVKRTGDLLEKLTWGFAIALVIFSLATHMVGTTNAGPVRSVNQQKAMETRTPAPVSLPGTTVPGATAPAGGAPAPAGATQPATAPATAPATPATN